MLHTCINTAFCLVCHINPCCVFLDAFIDQTSSSPPPGFGVAGYNTTFPAPSGNTVSQSGSTGNRVLQEAVVTAWLNVQLSCKYVRNAHSENPRESAYKRGGTGVVQNQIFHGLGREKMGSVFLAPLHSSKELLSA